MNKKIRSKKFGPFIGLFTFTTAPLAVILSYLFTFSNYDPSSGWITEADGDCQFYTTRNSAHRSFTWDGNCKEGLVHGQGKLSIFQSDRKLYDFEGILNNGKIDGYGVMRWAFDGDVYEGNFEHGALNGFGRSYNDDGDHYEGDFVNWQRHGQGTNWYEPENEKFKYEGEWKNDQPNGNGTLYYRDGRTKRGLFENGKFVSAGNPENPALTNYPKNVLITNDDGVEDMNRLADLVIATLDQASGGASAAATGA